MVMRLVVASLALLAFASFNAPARAQSGDTASARSFAEQGVAAFEKGDFAKASDLLVRAEKLRHAPPHLLWLARSYAKQGLLVEAREQYIALRRENLGANPPQAFIDAQTSSESELEALEPRIAYLTIRLSGVSDPSAVVETNGKKLDKVFVGVERPANPGHYELLANGDTSRSATQSFDLTEGQHFEVTLELAPRADASTGSRSESASDEKPSAIPLYSALGFGVAGIAVGTVFLVSHLDGGASADNAFNACAPSCSASERANVDNLDGNANTSLLISSVGYGVGVAGLTVATILWLGGSSAKETGAGPEVHLMARGNQIGLAGQF